MGTVNTEPGRAAGGTKVLLVIGHGRENSLCHRLLRAARDALAEDGAQLRAHDLLADGFDPVLRLPAGARHALPEHSTPLARRYQEDVLWMDVLVIVHPVWWFGPPAILKGWVDQVLVHGVAIEQQPAGSPQPLLRGRRALLIQTLNAPRVADSLLMRGMATQFWKRAVFISTGIELSERIALHEVEGMEPREIEAAEGQIRTAVRRLASSVPPSEG